jgi:hypothetical protein
VSDPRDEVEVLRAGDAFRESLFPRADAHRGPYPLWHGWALMDAYLAGVRAERERLTAVLAEIGRLTRWAESSSGGARESAADDMRRIKQLAEAATGLAFEEYT